MSRGGVAEGFALADNQVKSKDFGMLTGSKPKPNGQETRAAHKA